MLKRTLLRAAVIGAGFTLSGAGMTAPAYASGNTDVIQYNGIIAGNAYLHIFGGDGANMTVTEAGDGSNVTVTDTTAAAFSIQSPCQQTQPDTVVCPISNGHGLTVIATAYEGVGGSLTVDTPTLSVGGNLSNSGVTMSVPHSHDQGLAPSDISFGNGNDTFHGGVGVVRISLNEGTDVADLSDNPAEADTVTCGSANLETPSDTVTVDSADVINNSSNCVQINGPWSGTAPAAPSQLTANVVSQTQLQVTWHDNSLNVEDGFHIERCQGIGCSSFTQIATVLTGVGASGQTTESYVDSGLSHNTSYTYRVRAFNGAGNSAYSNTATIRTPR
jgi:hypothetical protein